MTLDASYIIEAEQRARRFSGAWTGTSGTLAADVMRLLQERKDLMGTIDELERRNAEMRAAVEARMAETPQNDPKMVGYSPMTASLAGCKPAQAAAAACLADVSKPMPEKFRALPPYSLIGLAGHIGSGKSAAAAMIPGAHHLQWADPIYRGLAAMLNVPESVLRDRATKESGIRVVPWAKDITLSPRLLTRTLGTEWGRDLVHPDLWVQLTLDRIAQIHALAGASVFAICGTRFPNEVTAIRENGGEVWWIDRPGLEVGSHKSDNAIGPDACDRIIRNNGTLEQLRQCVETVWQDFQESRAA